MSVDISTCRSRPALRFSLSFLASIWICLLSTSCSVPAGYTGESSKPVATEVVTSDGEMLDQIYFPTSCEASAQSNLEQGLALLHHMNYAKAKPAFKAASETDPECAIAYWGIGMTYVHPLWPDTVAGGNFAAGVEMVARAAGALHKTRREARRSIASPQRLQQHSLAKPLIHTQSFEGAPKTPMKSCLEQLPTLATGKCVLSCGRRDFS